MSIELDTLSKEQLMHSVEECHGKLKITLDTIDRLKYNSIKKQKVMEVFKPYDDIDRFDDILNDNGINVIQMTGNNIYSMLQSIKGELLSDG